MPSRKLYHDKESKVSRDRQMVHSGDRKERDVGELVQRECIVRSCVYYKIIDLLDTNADSWFA
jgi:hypothetical protein